MKNSNEFLANSDAAKAEEFDRAIKSGSINKDELCPVFDANENPFVVNGFYFYKFGDAIHPSRISPVKSRHDDLFDRINNESAIEIIPSDNPDKPGYYWRWQNTKSEVFEDRGATLIDIINYLDSCCLLMSQA